MKVECSPPPPPETDLESPSRVSAYASMVAATFFWSTNAIAVKFLLQEVPAFPAALLRITAAAAALAAWQLASGGKIRTRPAKLGQLVQLGIGGIALSFLFFTLALARTSVSHAVFIGALLPMTVLLFAYWQRQEQITALRLAGLLISLAGVLLLAIEADGEGNATWEGDLLATVGLLCFAFYTVAAKRIAALYDTLSLNTYTFSIATSFWLPVLLWESAHLRWSEISWVGWSALVYSAVLGSAGAYIAYYYSLRRLLPSQVAAFHYLQPVLATLLGVLLLNERVGPQFGLAAALILFGVFLAERR